MPWFSLLHRTQGAAWGELILTLPLCRSTFLEHLWQSKMSYTVPRTRSNTESPVNENSPWRKRGSWGDLRTNPRLRWYWGNTDFSSVPLRFAAPSERADMCLGMMAVCVTWTEGQAGEKEHLSVCVGKCTRRPWLLQLAAPHRTVPTTSQQQ